MLKPLLATRPTADRLRRLLGTPDELKGLGTSAVPDRSVAPGRTRIAVVYGGLTAATYDGNGTLVKPGTGEIKFHKIRHDGEAVIELDEQPTKAFSLITTPMSDLAEVLALRDLTIKDPDNPSTPQPGWIVIAARGGGGSERPEIKVGRDTAPGQSFTAAGTKQVGWKNTQTFNDDSDVFEQAHGANNLWEYITLKTAGRYRIHYRVNIEKQSTGSVDEILNISCYVVRNRGGADTVIDNSTDFGDLPAINDIGTPRGSMTATTVADFEANDKIRVDCVFAGSDSNNREVLINGGVFLVTRTGDGA